MPHIKPWLIFMEWGKKYGHISHIEIFGQHIVVVNSVKTAMDMLDNKSTIYSDRPILPVAGELIGWKNVMTLLPYGNQLRRHRKNFHNVIGTRAAVGIYSQVEEVETRRFLKRVFAKPNQLQAHIRHTAGAVILRISHGYEVKENNDPFIDLADRALDQWSHSTAPGAFFADVVPFLVKVPEWFPGAGFKRLAREWHDTLEEMVSAPYKFVIDQMAAGTAPESFTSKLVGGGPLSAKDEHDIKWSAATLYAGASDTTVSTIHSFFLAMTLFPDVQKKAHAEIDAVIGPDRLPSFADQGSLPYIEALAKEALRWHAVVFLTVPLRTIFMTGTISQRVPWSYLTSGQHPLLQSPGRSASALEDGMPDCQTLSTSPKPPPGCLSRCHWRHPKPFKCSIKPRSSKAVALIEQDANY
ncbi:cytochrome P450 [Suillus decipiens]|nr:cytochrome P450 [Suillus decipiens]